MRVARLLGAAAIALGATLAAPTLPTTLTGSVPLVGAGPAEAARCATTSNGVTVVVDYNQLGGGLIEGCVGDGGGKIARGIFTSARVSQVDVTRTPGFVCRVNGQPTAQQDPCQTTPPATAYWSLWWSNGQDGQWIYSNLGVNSLRVPAGGSVAWSWQGQSARSEPSTPPTVAAPSGGGSGGGGEGSQGGNGGSANGGGTGSGGSGGSGGPGSGDSPSSGSSPDGSPSAGATGPGGGDGAAGNGGGAGTGAGKGAGGDRAGKNGRAGTDDGAGKGGKNGRKGRDEGRDEADEDTSSGSSPMTDENGEVVDEDIRSTAQEDPAGLPAWVPLVVLVVLAGGGVGAVLWRRRTAGGA